MERVVRKRRPDYIVLAITGVLMLLGLILMYAIGPQRANVLNNAYGTDFSASYFFLKQLAHVALAALSFYTLYKLSFEKLMRISGAILITGFALSGLLYVTGNILNIPQVATCTLGACRWLNLGPFGSLQPAEILKFGFLLYGAAFLASRVARGELNDRQKTILPFIAVMCLAALFVVVLQKDLGSGAALMGIPVSMLFVAGLNVRNGLMLVSGILVLGLLAVVTSPYRMERIATFFKGDQANIKDEGYQIAQAKISIGSGGLGGRGIGGSVGSTGYLPEAINDSIFAIMGEMFGFFGLSIILALFTGLLMRLLKITDGLGDARMRLVAAGIFGWLATHIVLNVAAMTGVFPLTGITLPLLSSGGTSMLFMAGALGLSLNLSRFASGSIAVNKGERNENSRSRRGVGRSRDAGRRRPQYS